MKSSFLKSNGFIYSTSIILLTLILFAFLQPTLQAFTLPQSDTAVLNTFLEETKTSQTIDTKKFWETREFYAPGHIVLNKKGFPDEEFKSILNNMNTDIHLTDAHPFLRFDSKSWHSAEILTPATKVIDVIKEPKKDATEVVLETDTELIYYTDHNTLKIFFVKPVEVMKSTNGYLDYGQYDLDILKDKNWLVINEVQL